MPRLADPLRTTPARYAARTGLRPHIFADLRTSQNSRGSLTGSLVVSREAVRVPQASSTSSWYSRLQMSSTPSGRISTRSGFKDSTAPGS